MTVKRIDELAQWDRDATAASQPKFAFIHLMLPHPPMFQNRECLVRVDERLAGRNVKVPEADSALLESRRRSWVEQVECANSVVHDLVDRRDDGDIVNVISDHGPDSVFELSSPSDPGGLHERLSNLIAIRLPEQCRSSVPENLQLNNVFRVVLACISDERIPMLPNASYVAGFTGPLLEVDV